MRVDLGFWDINGKYIEDIQEVGDEEMTLSIEDINKLESENKRLKAEVKQWKHEYKMLDACIELLDIKINDLKEENARLQRWINESNKNSNGKQ